MLNDNYSISHKKVDKRLIGKATGFFFVLLVIVLGAFSIKLFLNKGIQNSVIGMVLLPMTVQVVLILSGLLLYLLYTRTALVRSPKDLYAVGTTVMLAFVINIFLAMFGVYAMPTALAAFLIVPVGKRRDAFIGNLFCNFLILSAMVSEYVYALDSATLVSTYELMDLFIMFVLGVSGGTVASYTLSNKTGRFNYVVRGALIGIATYAVMILLTVSQGIYRDTVMNTAEDFAKTYLFPMLPLGAVCAFTPLLLGLVAQPVVERIFNLVTDTRLVELTDHNSPLIRRLAEEAPGTFNHSLAVAVLAEMCAAAIGENTYLARAAAYYHDVGKLENPQYYKENQMEVNLHDELLPEVSADIIRAHTEDGLKLCNAYRIPSEVSHVTVQHHGTLLIAVFYEKAKKLTDGEVDPKQDYSYHGQTPTTKIAAIIMLCDAGEAAIRAMDAPDGEKVDKLLSGLIASRIASGQFDNCDISLKDLNTIKNTITAAYGGLYHKRLKYPDGKS